MGSSEVVARWLAISMASSSGSASNSDVGHRLTAMIVGVDVVLCGAQLGQPRAHVAAWMEQWHVRGWSYGVWMVARRRAREAERHDRLALIKEEAGEVAKQGL